MQRLKNPHIIWDEGCDLSAEIEDLREKYPDCDDNELYDIALKRHYNRLDYERNNLNVFTNQIIVFADLGLWNGRRDSMKVLGHNLSNILYSFMNGECKFFSDGVDLCGTEYHHDGTNHYVYRELKPQFSADTIENIFRSGKTFTRKMMTYYTKSLVPYANEVYGW